ncbi:MAG: hypothetical protein AB9M60_19410 [Leptothrix sp. (in: b-proteobacteria)]
MTLLEGALLALWLLTLAAGGFWFRREQQRAADQARDQDANLAMAREAAARQLLQLRARLAEQEEELAKIPGIRSEVARLRNKYRRLYVRYIELAGRQTEAAQDTSHPDLVAPETRPDASS